MIGRSPGGCNQVQGATAAVTLAAMSQFRIGKLQILKGVWVRIPPSPNPSFLHLS